MKMSNKIYDTLKYIVTIMFPAVITCYVTLSSIWGWPYTEAVAGSLAGVNTLLGTLMGISTVKYNKQKELAENA